MCSDPPPYLLQPPGVPQVSPGRSLSEATSQEPSGSGNSWSASGIYAGRRHPLAVHLPGRHRAWLTGAPEAEHFQDQKNSDSSWNHPQSQGTDSQPPPTAEALHCITLPTFACPVVFLCFLVLSEINSLLYVNFQCTNLLKLIVNADTLTEESICMSDL